MGRTMSDGPGTGQPYTKEQPKIADRCPSCGAQSLFVGAGGWLTCDVVGCKEPGVSSHLDAERAHSAKLAERVAELERGRDIGNGEFVSWQYAYQQEKAVSERLLKERDVLSADYAVAIRALLKAQEVFVWMSAADDFGQHGRYRENFQRELSEWSARQSVLSTPRAKSVLAGAKEVE